MDPEVDNILDVTEDITDTKLEITPVVKSSPVESIIQNKECVCDKCGKECKDKRGLTLHVKKCEGFKIHQCEHCGDEFSNQYILAVHYTRCKIIKDQNKEKEENTKQQIIKSLSSQENENEILKAQMIEMELKYKKELSELQDSSEIELKYKKELSELRDSLETQIKYKDLIIQSCKNDIQTLSQELKYKKEENKILLTDNHTLINIISNLSLKCKK
jgi:hypothetical protein